MQEPTTEPIELEGAPALSRAGNVFILLAVIWAIVGQLVVIAAFYSVGLPGDGTGWPGLVVVFVGYLVVSFGPLAVTYAARRAGHRLPFRWMLASPQPGARLDSGGIELCTPEDGCSRFNWDEIGGMEPDPAWASSVGGWPDLELRSVDGRLLMGVPASIYEELHPIGSRWLSGPRTLAERIVVMWPDKFTFADTDLDPPHYGFRRVDDLTSRFASTTGVPSKDS